MSKMTTNILESFNKSSRSNKLIADSLMLGVFAYYNDISDESVGRELQFLV